MWREKKFILKISWTLKTWYILTKETEKNASVCVCVCRVYNVLHAV